MYRKEQAVYGLLMVLYAAVFYTKYVKDLPRFNPIIKTSKEK